MWGCEAAAGLQAIHQGGIYGLGNMLAEMCARGTPGPFALSTIVDYWKTKGAIGLGWQQNLNGLAQTMGETLPFPNAGLGNSVTAHSAQFRAAMALRSQAPPVPTNPSPAPNPSAPTFTPPTNPMPHRYDPGPSGFTPPTSRNGMGQTQGFVDVGGLIGGCKICQFSKDRIAMADTAEGKTDWMAVGMGADGFYKYSHQGIGGPWRTPCCDPATGLIDEGGWDKDYDGPVSQAMTKTAFIAAARAGTNGTGTGTTGTPIESGMCGPTPPMMTQRRTCGPGRILGRDGMCHDKKSLRAADRLNKSKKAEISYSDKQTVNKALRIAKRFLRYTDKTKTLQAAARAVEREKKKRR